MKTAIKYIEFKSTHHTDADEAWIAKVWLSSSCGIFTNTFSPLPDGDKNTAYT